MKKIFSKVSIFVFIICALSFVFSACGEELPDEPEYDAVVTCARTLKGMMKDPESFSVYGTCYYGENNDGEVVIISYRAANSYGAYLTNIAYFVDGNYFGSETDYTSGDYKNWSFVKQYVFAGARQVRTKGTYSKSYDDDIVMKGLSK